MRDASPPPYCQTIERMVPHPQVRNPLEMLGGEMTESLGEAGGGACLLEEVLRLVS